MVEGIQITIHPVGTRSDVALVVVSGYVDTTTCHELANVFRDLIDQQKYLMIVDLGAVSYISSAGWGVFMGEIKRIRELGGDIKLVQMPPEVNEVFEMLEFHRIMNAYETFEEALDEFDLVRGIDITNPVERIPPPNTGTPSNSETVRVVIPVPSRVPKGKIDERVALKDLPLLEKVKHIILEDPMISIGGICKALRTEKYGKVRIGWFKMRSLLKKQSLETKEKRYRFYRSR